MSDKQYKLDYYSFFGFILLAILTVGVWRFPWGYYVMYPFTLLGTWFHEMGHGIAAIMVGGSFEKLQIFEDGSGLATTGVRGEYYLRYEFARAIISCAGLMGPPIMGAILILMSKSFRKSTVILYALSICMLLSVVIWVRTPIGAVIVAALGGLFLLIAVKGGEIFKQLVVQIIGLQACISTYMQIGYLYVGKAVVDGVERNSDTGSIAENLGGTYSLWGTIILIMSFVLLITSLYYRNRRLVVAEY